MKETQEYLTISGHCPANGTHRLVIIQWPYVKCEHCDQEYVLFTRDMVEAFFEVNFFRQRLNS